MDKLRKFGRLVSLLRVEPAAALCVAGIVLTYIRTENILLLRICEVDFQLNKTLCDDFVKQNGDFKDLEVEVQKEMANLKSYTTIFTISNGIAVLVLGPLSDKFGRKFVMMISCIGNILQPISVILLLEYTHVKAIVISLVNQGVQSVGGGIMMFGIGASSHIVDITGIEERSMRLGVFEMFYGIGTLLASAMGAILSDLNVGDYETLYIAIAMQAASLFVVAFIVKERRCGKEETTIKSGKNCLHIAKSFGHAIIRKRDGNDRFKLGLLIIAYLFIQAPFYGESQLMYLFLRKRLNWDLSQYSYFNIALTCTRSAGIIISLWILSKMLKLSDLLIGVISGVSQISACLAYTFSFTTWAMYTSLIIDVLNGTFAVIPRSIMSKLVSGEEAGTIFTVMALISVASPSAVIPLYTYVYNRSLEVDFEGGFNLLSMALSLPPFLILLLLYCKYKSDAISHKTDEQVGNISATVE